MSFKVNTEPDSKDIEVVTKIASEFLHEEISSVRSIGEGSNNKNFLAETSQNKVVVKLSHEQKAHRAFEDYKKEQWCIEKSSALGVSGPSVLAMGEAGNSAYMIESLVPGINGKELMGDKTKIWKRVGEYTKLIHSINVTGFGENLFNDTPGGQGASWQKFLDYNIDSLTSDDKLIGLGVLTLDQSQLVKDIFIGLKEKEFNFGLNHGDIAIWNTLVEPSGNVHLLDWGCAEAHIVPHFDMLHIITGNLESGSPNNDEVRAFLEGYGISETEFETMKPELNQLLLLKSFDKLRWAIDKNPSAIPEFTERAGRFVQINLS